MPVLGGPHSHNTASALLPQTSTANEMSTGKKSTASKRKADTAGVSSSGALSPSSTAVKSSAKSKVRDIHLVDAKTVLQKLNAFSDSDILEAVLAFARICIAESRSEYRSDHLVIDFVTCGPSRLETLTKFVRSVYSRLIGHFGQYADKKALKLNQFAQLTEDWSGITQAASIYETVSAKQSEGMK